MNPQDPSSFNHRTESLKTGRKYHFIDQKPQAYNPRRTPTLLCIHGFPDFWFGWRYQIGPWVRRGLRVVAPDMLGYGGTDKPTDPSEYSTKKLCNDLAALLDLLEVKKAVSDMKWIFLSLTELSQIVVGHDWGSFTASRFALWHPDRLLALVILSLPYTPPSPIYIPVEEVAKRAPDLAYMLYFNDNRSTRQIENNIGTFIRVAYRKPRTSNNFSLSGLAQHGSNPFENVEIPNSDLVLNEREFEIMRQTLSKGMNGPLNYYRTAKFRHDEELAAGLHPNLRPDLPVLFMWGTLDKTTTKTVIGKAHKFVPRIQDVALEGRGHWLMVEAKDEITEKVISWLESLMEKPTQCKL
ncbi:hypothetical protein VNI00_001111 [Paramarasmius palmivorus]|uniref:AB hydrolase-1 domain-containing protein n=1 Tax=Paramarasmius palmivorus TaxID=297713 RepID=A0AAW0E911_9AGAR